MTSIQSLTNVAAFAAVVGLYAVGFFTGWVVRWVHRIREVPHRVIRSGRVAPCRGLSRLKGLS